MTSEWATPQDIFDQLHSEFAFALDVCALPANAKCSTYYSPIENGLAQEWRGSVWMNPPYGREIGLWMQKAFESSAHEGTIVVALIPTRTNAPWWHDYVMQAAEIRFIKKKISFVGLKNGVPFTGHAIVVFRGDCIGQPRVSSFTRNRR